jgi:hypothetical protein
MSMGQGHESGAISKYQENCEIGNRHMLSGEIRGQTLAMMLPSAGIQAPGGIDGIVVAVGSSTPVPSRRRRMILAGIASTGFRLTALPYQRIALQRNFISILDQSWIPCGGANQWSPYNQFAVERS